MASLTQLKNGAILIADDSEAIRVLIKEAIATSGMKGKIFEADNGVDAVKLFKEFRPELVILDIFMPKADGLQALKAMLVLDKKVKIIITSSTDNQKLVSDGIKLGARGALLKPFDKQFVLHTIGNVLNQKW
jgi:two-component system, chemotaxis family, chemotaxis protein CheY